jgi:hypothetical protein
MMAAPRGPAHGPVCPLDLACVALWLTPEQAKCPLHRSLNGVIIRLRPWL